MNRLHSAIRNETFQGLAVLFAFLVIFFWTPISQLGDHLFSASDITQEFALTRIQENYRPQNPLFTDVIELMQPWLIFNRDMLRQGKFPLWNPYNANGSPHLANYQSAVFSPFSLPLYILPWNWGLLVSAFLKLFSIGGFTFLFLKQLRLKQIPALVGSTAFMFSGYNVVWLNWSLAPSVVVLPASLFVAECIMQRFQAKPSRLPLPLLLGFSVSLSIGLLTGHPETFYFSFLVLSLYVLFRGAELLNSGVPIRKLLQLAGGFCAAGMLAASLAAIQVIPFAEYVINSAPVDRSVMTDRFASLQWFQLSVYPNLWGNPSDSRTIDVIGQFFNYNEINAAYVGGACLLLVILALLFSATSRHKKLMLFFFIIGLVWFLYATNLMGLKHWFDLIPGMASAFYGRSMPVWTFTISCLAAFALDHIITVRKPQRAALIITVIAGIGFLLITAWGAVRAVGLSTLVLGTKMFDTAAILSHAQVVQGHFWQITIANGLAVAALALLWSSNRKIRLLSGTIVLLVVFYEGGVILKDYNPTSEARFFYPVTSAMQNLKDNSSETLVMGDKLLVPNTNLPYQVPIVGSTDALGVNRYVQLVTDQFGFLWYDHIMTHVNELGLKLFGVDTIITPPGFSDLPQTDKLQCQPFETYQICKYQGLPLYHVVTNAIIAHSDDEAFATIKGFTFDPAQTVVLTAPELTSSASESQAEAPPVQVISEDSMRVVLNVTTRGNPGYLVLDKTYYPGWKAKVNGVSKPVYRANYAFSAVPLDSGENTVEFYYDPDSFKIGAALSGMGLIVSIVLGFHWFRTHKGR